MTMDAMFPPDNGREEVKLYRVADSTIMIGDARDMNLLDFPHEYRVIIADPPWPYRRKRARGVTGDHYESLTDEEIGWMPVKELAARDCALFLWATWPKLPVALDIMKKWSFDYVTGFPWVKTTNGGNGEGITPSYGVGFWVRGASEIILIGRRGNARAPRLKGFMGLLSPNLRHSRKPDSVHEIAEAMPGPYLELFARRSRPGWTVFGNEIQGMLA